MVTYLGSGLFNPNCMTKKFVYAPCLKPCEFESTIYVIDLQFFFFFNVKHIIKNTINSTLLHNTHVQKMLRRRFLQNFKIFKHIKNWKIYFSKLIPTLSFFKSFIYYAKQIFHIIKHSTSEQIKM